MNAEDIRLSKEQGDWAESKWRAEHLLGEEGETQVVVPVWIGEHLLEELNARVSYLNEAATKLGLEPFKKVTVSSLIACLCSAYTTGTKA